MTCKNDDNGRMGRKRRGRSKESEREALGHTNKE
jgi:hypothetical protein